MNQQKKILFVYYKLFKPGGIARVLTNLANELAEDYDVTILVLMEKHESFYELDKRVKLIFVNSFAHWAFSKVNVSIDKYLRWLPKRQNFKNYFYDFGAYRTVEKWLSENHSQYDTIITSMYKLSAGASLNRKFNKKVVAWEHSEFSLGGKIWKYLRKNYSANLKAVVATNKAAEEYYRSIGANSYFMINLMNDLIYGKNYIPQSQKQNRILMASNFYPEKNVPGFLEIISDLEIPDDWSVSIIGDGPQREKIESYIHDHNLSGKVELLGSLTFDKVVAKMSESKIFCLTSVTETFGLVLVEAMFCSNVLLAYDCNHGPKDIVNETNGFLIPLHDKEMYKKKLKFLMDHPDELEELSRSAFEQTSMYRKEAILKQWAEVLS